MSQELENARSVLVEFAQRMNAWEVESHELVESGGLEKHLETIKSGLIAIYDRYVTKRERKTGRLAGMNVGYPPEYDMAQETFVGEESPGKGKAVFETLWTHPVMRDYTEKRKYTLVFKNGEWQVDKKEAFSTVKGKWVNHPF